MNPCLLTRQNSQAKYSKSKVRIYVYVCVCRRSSVKKNIKVPRIRCYSIHRFHHLKLYPEEDSGPMSTKKPVVVESYDEIVFPEPSESILARMQNFAAVTLPRLPSGLSLPPPGMFKSFIICKKKIFYLTMN